MDLSKLPLLQNVLLLAHLARVIILIVGAIQAVAQKLTNVAFRDIRREDSTNLFACAVAAELALEIFLLELKLLELIKRQIGIIGQVICLKLLLQFLFLNDLGLFTINKGFKVNPEAIHGLSTGLAVVNSLAFHVQF